ncbi:GFA family protein [Sulfitobacter albidus]|uniref:GFA family protein n=1 Tax=Sulfitobacter albidus TaxID=2829501 RepID=A0A975PLN0_9RHOB|nr:GFA family protein [Sulfitobacter albidus]QUJ75859.1 GFA family protein [Sulfitobacter albidus]
MAITGRCYCGACTYEVTGDIQWQAQCLCRECQYISGGGPNFFMLVNETDYAITKGTPSQFTRSDIENPRTRDFCPTCGTHLNTRIKERGAVVVKVGTLDDPSVYDGPQMAIYACDRQPFHALAEGMPVADKRP